ncbi:uncharacterized protein LOC124146566 isoform X2 [Haliotis rufescens]|nr:uncharacterized protein LOC124146566 isoform X2 [Haliotis rufescens]XP_048257669.1 uncharacterized protein LOC124146566 isoform X2 [Haliotis rufescens]XP_048257670.1 uncharacterized protein LOC124146566 isoform X2 [Haliotis rufescens]XP_048257671.1 uncharacterized protein LOC124146566 isoform X2 [Haliotis rufescens]XP_048257672.1 uncharacterized protein LOC124146566 isoform X2 [Haliotis rufescens]XP_048257673.1 uncharacterized protein LOC124146566 isoform X2 [Haliotis rufescens]XP_04825767
MMCECRVLCLLMVLLIALESSSALIAPTSDVDVNPICKTTMETLIPHPTKCAQYYNCSAPGMIIHRYGFLGQNLQECPFPELYNPETQRCEHYCKVTCGNRTEPLGKCEYEQHACPGGKYCGIPCHVHNPTCRNLSDGLNVYEWRLNTPNYVVCVNQRLVYTGVCHDYGTGAPIFDAKLRACRCS